MNNPFYFNTDSVRVWCDINLPYSDNRNFEEFRFKVDTGADSISIPLSVLYSLGYTDRDIKSNKSYKQIKVKTPSGETTMERIVLPQINIGDYVFQNVETLVTKTDSILLGLNVLSAFDIDVSFTDKTIITKFRGVNGEGSVIRPITEDAKDFCAHEIHNTSDIKSIAF